MQTENLLLIPFDTDILFNTNIKSLHVVYILALLVRNNVVTNY